MSYQKKNVPVKEEKIFEDINKTVKRISTDNQVSEPVKTFSQGIGFQGRLVKDTVSKSIDKRVKVSAIGEIEFQELLEILLTSFNIEYILNVSSSKVQVNIEGEYTQDEINRLLEVLCQVNGCKVIKLGSRYVITKNTEEISNVGLSVFCYRFQYIKITDALLEKLSILNKGSTVILNDMLIYLGSPEEIVTMKNMVTAIDKEVLSQYIGLVVTVKDADLYVIKMNEFFAGLGVSLEGVVSFIKLGNSTVFVMSKTEDYIHKIKEVSQVFLNYIDDNGKYTLYLKYRSASDAVLYIQKIDSKVKVVADDISNSVVVYGSKTELKQVHEIIRTFDKKPSQLYVKVYLIDIKSSKTLDAGVEMLFDGGSLKVSNITKAASIGGFGIVGELGNLKSFFNMLERNFSAKVISRPSLFVRSGEEAKIRFATSVPFITSKTITPIASGIVQNVEYRDVGIILTIKGVIVEGNEILLDVYVENSSLQARAGVEDNPIFLTDSVQTRFIVGNREVALLGGIKLSQKSEVTRGIPFLNKLRYVGALFGVQNYSGEKREMMVCLCPQVVTSGDMDSIGIKILDKYKDYVNN
ncbi:MAG: secretin N-terminal domain-containing protein [Candidatus Jettenia caeni]|nr:MAG: secretin N-terminal domain-containing protein [Candidatus Jettenia caeni]